jgi:hypothetical protein
VCDRRITVAGRSAPFGIDVLFRTDRPTAFTFHVEICEDFGAPLPPSTNAALAGPRFRPLASVLNEAVVCNLRGAGHEVSGINRILALPCVFAANRPRWQALDHRSDLS